MKPTSINLSSFHSDLLRESRLGKLCGSQELFSDRYKILRILGRGGFGVTFLAQDVSLPGEPLCVIKQLCPRINSSRDIKKAIERFEREAKTLSLLGSHSQIPMLLNYFVVENEFYLVQEYIQGHTLARLVRRMGPVSEATAKGFLREMLVVLNYIHTNHVIHRDLKPQNIIRCSEDNRLVLIDFGAVKEITQIGENEAKPAPTQFIGTVGFAPPEQFSMRPAYASDIYALGMTCVYLLTGKPPLDFECDRRTGEILWHDFVQISDSFREVLQKMMKMAIAERYQSANAVLRALNQELTHDNLAQCLAVQPRPKNQSPIIEQESHTPYHRTAKAIRNWRARLQNKQQPKTHPHNSQILLSTSH